MTTATWGGLLGGLAALGLLLVVTRIAVLRRPQLAVRVLPYVRDVPRLGPGRAVPDLRTAPVSAAAGVFGPPVRRAALR